MIIYGKPDVPIPGPSAPLSDLFQFPVMQTREDYRELFRSEPPEPDPMLRRKHWLDPGYAGMQEDDGEEVSYIVLAVDPRTGQPKLNSNGAPYLTTLTISKYLAGRVNIPAGMANEYPAETPIMRFTQYQIPLRPLHADEYLAMSPGPISVPIVINRAKQSVDLRSILDKVRELLSQLESRLPR